MTEASPRVAATLFDGRSAARHDVSVSIEAASLRIERPDGTIELVDLADVQRSAAGAGGDRLTRPRVAGWRLDFADGLPPPLTHAFAAPARYGRFIDRFGLLPASIALGAVSAAAVAIVLMVPQWLAPLVPQAVERRIGEAIIGDMAASTCHTPAGDRALQRLVQAVDLPGRRAVRPQVVKLGMVNAVALPGDRIVLFSGLLDELKSPDAVAGVVAHELGHARERHVMQAMLRQLGISALLAGTSGTATSQAAELTSLRYSRSAEADADAFARARLASARISPVPTARFFAKLAKQEPGGAWVAMLASHPDAASRATAFGAAARKDQAYAPALTPAEWKALARICTDDRKAKALLDIDGF